MTIAVVATSTLRQADMEIADHLSRDLRRAEEFIQLAVVAAHQVLGEAPALDGHRTGIYLGTAFGPMACNLSVLDDLVMAQTISPTLFSHSVFNAAAGYIARICKIYGPALTLTSYGWPFFRALQAAWLAIEDGEVEAALVLQVETYSPLLDDARKAILPGPAPWPPGATAWLLGHNGPCLLDQITVSEEPCRPETRLARCENNQQGQDCHPLSAAEELSALVNAGQFPKSWQRTADFGRLEVNFSRTEA